MPNANPFPRLSAKALDLKAPDNDRHFVLSDGQTPNGVAYPLTKARAIYAANAINEREGREIEREGLLDLLAECHGTVPRWKLGDYPGTTSPANGCLLARIDAALAKR